MKFNSKMIQLFHLKVFKLELKMNFDQKNKINMQILIVIKILI